MLTDAEFRNWCVTRNLSTEAVSLIAAARQSDPSRRVRCNPRSVTGRYPSRKMHRAIQFESHHNELAVILELEHDPTVLEYWDQPPPIKLAYDSKAGKRLAVLHTPDFCIIRDTSAMWVECKTEEDLLQLAEKQPNRYRRDAAGRWRCPPGEAFAAPYGLNYLVKSSAEIDWVFQRNVLFLEDYLRAENIEVQVESLNYLRALVASRPGLSLADLLSEVHKHEIPSDSIYIALLIDSLYVDLTAAPLARPDQVRVYFDESTARQYQDTGRHQPAQPSPPVEAATIGERFVWDGQTWEVINKGQSKAWLKNGEGAVVSLSEAALTSLLASGVAVIHRDVADGQSLARSNETAYSILAAASPEALAEANRRYSLLNDQQGDNSVPERTIRRWRARFRAAEIRFQCGFVGLLPSTGTRGNRNRKLPDGTVALMSTFVEDRYEDLRQSTRFSVWSLLYDECKKQGLIPPSYRTFCLAIARRPRHQQAVKRQGRRAAYSDEEFFYELSMTTPRHGDRPFEIAHIDHTELDVELICSQTRRNLGRPWLTLLMDAFSRRLLAVYLTFDPPSYRSCMMVFRECVRRHHRLPQTLVMDGGREFDSIFFETLLAYYGITKKTRPASKARFGSICERLFGSSHTRFIYNLIGNTQLAKENVRFITKEVDPKHLAVWTFGALMGRLEQWAYEVYDTLDHPALGQSPRDAFQTAQTQAGARLHRVCAYNEEFEMLTLPTTTKGTARVVPGRGVLINSIYYWSEALRRSSVEGAQVPVRYDPFNLGRAFVYAGGYWHQCLSQHYLEFRERTEREVMIAAAELRRRNRLRGVRQAITASRLAAFLKEVQDEEAILQQRLHDAEERRARQPQAPHHPPATISQVSQAVSPTQETVTDSGVSTPSVATAFDLTETPAPENLDLYEAY